MFRHQRVTDGQAYQLPALGTATMKAFLEYIYTYQTDITNLRTTAAIIELAHASELYNLQPLKAACGSVLWKRVIQKLEDSFDIIRFAELLPDMQYLKHRAMDVLCENWDKLNQISTVRKLRNRFGGGDQGDRLRDEFDLYLPKRLEGFEGNGATDYDPGEDDEESDN